MGVQKFNMIILIVIIFWKCKSPLKPALIQKPGVTQGLQNWFLSPKAVSCQPIVYQQLMILGKRSYNLLQSEPGREQRDGWAARGVRQRGSAPAVQAVSVRGTWKVPISPAEAGEGYWDIFPLIHQDLLCVRPLCRQKSFVAISAPWVFLSDFSFSPCSAGDGPE